ncbi:MAG: peptidylprolyl isomerase [Pseudanabaenaceae cyanobacterium SKYGB_i_bin29]|nr:peptidylprolyl isomerase [Pseudanabaenaceae cyanobacterium SKYG29]MDW8420334.1 peptidylprolyl isomerase [Pseudanabaenaceae cyanobacterium SKYGB_i_bin29]
MFLWLARCLLVVCLLLTAACTIVDNSDAKNVPPGGQEQPMSSSTISEAKKLNLPQLQGKATVEMKLPYGTVVMEIDGNNAPITAGNFVDLVNKGFYNGLTFHRVVKDPSPFVAQGGDPQGTGTGSYVDPKTGRVRYIPLEIWAEGDREPTYSRVLQPGVKPKLKHSRGAVAMARTPTPDSASSQFYIALADINFLDGQYAVFGYVKSGMEYVDQIKVGDKIESARVTQGIENLKLP